MAEPLSKDVKSDMDNEEYWESSEWERKGLPNLFDEKVDFENLRPSNRIFVGQETLEDCTEKTQNSDMKRSSSSHQTFPTQKPKIALDSNMNMKNPLTELSKKDAEIEYLKRKIIEVVHPSTTVLRIVLGQNYSLEVYKSKEDKILLLDEAILSCDGNAILIVVLFLERTMKPSLFNSELSKRPVAMEHYFSYLQSESSTNKFTDALCMFCRPEQAAISKFKVACNVTNTSSKISSLKKCLMSHFQCDPNLGFESSILQHYINLLELQIPIQENDEKEIERKNNKKLEVIPPSVSLVGTSALTTLYYSCLYHFDKPENFLGSPISVKKSQQLSEKQFIWKAISALVRFQSWTQLEALFMTKTWIGGNKMKSSVGFDRVVALLHHMSAPKEVKEKYCRLIEDVNNRIEVASKYGCHEIVLLTYKDLKNKQKIETYRLNLKSKTPEDFLASQILSDMSIKWRN